MKIKSVITFFAAAAFAASPSLLRADAIPYQNIGTPAPANVFVATSTGDVWAYFYASDAGYDSTIGLWVNNASTGVSGLANHSSAQGAALNLGWANVGDVLTFELLVSTTGTSWFSDPTLNSDKLNHVYSTFFSPTASIPYQGLYIAFEDLPGLGDVDYNDHQFVVTNVTTRAVPDTTSTLVLGAIAFAGLGFMRRRLKA